jgi:hypothetical protein
LHLLGARLLRLELGEVHEVLAQRQRDLRSDVRHLQLPRLGAKLLHGHHGAVDAVADVRDRLARPLLVEVVDGVPQGRGGAGVVLRGDEDERVAGADPLRPPDRVRTAAGGDEGGNRLVQQRQFELLQVEHVEQGLVTGVPRGQLLDPCGHLLALTAGTRAADDDADPGHGCVSCSGRGAVQQYDEAAARIVTG